jgi:hypothetical protein
VRPLHLLASLQQSQNDDDSETRLKTVKSDFRAIFRFYTEHVSPHVSKFHEDFRIAEEVKSINAESGLLKAVTSQKIEFKSFQPKITNLYDALVPDKVNIVVSHSVTHVIAVMISHLENVKSHFICIDFKVLNEVLEKVNQSNLRQRQLHIIVSCTNKSEAFESEMQKTIRFIDQKPDILLSIVISAEHQNDLSNELRGCLNFFIINFVWDDWTETYQEKLLATDINIQGDFVPLIKVLNKTCKALNHLPVEKFLEDNMLVVKASDLGNWTSYIERKFENGNNENEWEKTYDWLIDKMDGKQFAIISGIPGSGKSTCLREIYVSLKKTFYG